MLLQLPSRVLEVELTLVSSNHHVEMNPSDVGNNDRYVVQEILKVSYWATVQKDIMLLACQGGLGSCFCQCISGDGHLLCSRHVWCNITLCFPKLRTSYV